jgi:hypothetical protein
MNAMANENRPPHIRIYQQRLREIQSDKNRKETLRGLAIGVPIAAILVFCAIQIIKTFP